MTRTLVCTILTLEQVFYIKRIGEKKKMEFNVNKVQVYEAKNSFEVRALSEVPDGTILRVSGAYLDGENDVTYLFTEDGIFATNSPIVAEKITEIIDTFNELGEIKILRRKSKNGRTFTSCVKILS